METLFHKILILGSGGLSIGQAGEFDYSGSQAIKAFVENGLKVIVVNPNIATVQTNPTENVKIYLYPIEPDWIEKIIALEKPDSIVGGFGGQTALNCLIELDRKGVLKKYNVRSLGSSTETIRICEDRKNFADFIRKINLPVPLSKSAESVNDAKIAAEQLGFPVIVRAGYALGGLTSGFASNLIELGEIVQTALRISKNVLIEKSLKGWKEIEYEVMRDRFGNTIVICNMENFDPLGIHTGDSIVVAPCQTLNDQEFQNLRDASLKIANELNIIGQCNVQFAVDTASDSFCVIEVNARLSRSSALASKATGYPIAYIAANVVLGKNLIDIKNPVTGVTSAFFEPALDYVAIKIPRWDFAKFPGTINRLSTSMASVGEVMAIGKTFCESFQKAVRMMSEDEIGISSNSEFDKVNLTDPTSYRVFSLANAFRNNISVDNIYDQTKIDRWFLYQIESLIAFENQIKTAFANVSNKQDLEHRLNSISKLEWQIWKQNGFGDEQIATLSNCRNLLPNLSLQIRRARSALGILPVVKKIDTSAGEFLSSSNYLYFTYFGTVGERVISLKNIPAALILGSGAYRIGTSVEFDWCTVACAKELRAHNWTSVIVNCNPETVSTDYHISDALYFEELTTETILDIIEVENCVGVILSMGGQLPNKLAKQLSLLEIKLLGHNAETIDQAEDRVKFSSMLDRLSILQPRWISAHSVSELREFVKKVGFPLIIRPSYVLSGTAMKVCYDQSMLDKFLEHTQILSHQHSIIICEFLNGAREIEIDGVANNGTPLQTILSEHIENAGVHSGDATIILPPPHLSDQARSRIEEIVSTISYGLKLNGPFNMQMLLKGEQISVIECNARASRTFPFASKVTGVNLATLATQVSLNLPNIQDRKIQNKNKVGVKAPMFSFNRLLDFDPVLGVEMVSTGEVGCIANAVDEALLLALQSAGIRRPEKGILISSGNDADKVKFLDILPALKFLNLPIFATPGTAQHFRTHGLPVTLMSFPGLGTPDAIDAISSGWVDFVVNIPKNFGNQEIEFGAKIRRTALQHGCMLMTNTETTLAFFKALKNQPLFIQCHEVCPL